MSRFVQRTYYIPVLVRLIVVLVWMAQGSTERDCITSNPYR